MPDLESECWKETLRNSNRLEQDDKNGYRSDVAHEGLPDVIDGGVLNAQLGFGGFDFHEPASKNGDEYAF
ncbi:MAG: hypothetical protein ACPGYT_14210 [Nitrospirales bacterium]